MDKFEEYIKARYPVDCEHLKEKYPNVPVCEFYGDEKDLWQLKQTEIDFLKAQLSIKRDQVNGFESEIKKAWQALEEKDKKLKAVEQILIELKESMTNFKEMDLYDKGVRVVTDCTIRDLEKAIRGEHE